MSTLVMLVGTVVTHPVMARDGRVKVDVETSKCGVFKVHEFQVLGGAK